MKFKDKVKSWKSKTPVWVRVMAILLAVLMIASVASVLIFR